jgi:hypothetical protein
VLARCRWRGLSIAFPEFINAQCQAYFHKSHKVKKLKSPKTAEV